MPVVLQVVGGTSAATRVVANDGLNAAVDDAENYSDAEKYFSKINHQCSVCRTFYFP